MKRIYFFAGILVLFSSCGGYLTELAKKGEAAYLSGDFDTALVALEKAIQLREDAGKLAKGLIYANAGKSAFALDKHYKAIDYFEKAVQKEYVDAAMYAFFAESYRKIDNLSKEIKILEQYIEKFPEGKDLTVMCARLFGTYVEIGSWDNAQQLWPALEEQAKTDLVLKGNYLWLNDGLNKKDICDDLAKELLNADVKNMDALEWYGKKYYYKAEDKYQAEMAKYNKKKTQSNYAKLVKALKGITVNFKISKDYYLKLYKVNANPEYAQYLSNIYARLSNKEKAEYYRKKAK